MSRQEKFESFTEIIVSSPENELFGILYRSCGTETKEVDFAGIPTHVAESLYPNIPECVHMFVHMLEHKLEQELTHIKVQVFVQL